MENSLNIKTIRVVLGRRSISLDYELHFRIFSEMKGLGFDRLDSSSFEELELALEAYAMTSRKASEADMMLADLVWGYLPSQISTSLARKILSDCPFKHRRDALLQGLTYNWSGLDAVRRASIESCFMEYECESKNWQTSMKYFSSRFMPFSWRYQAF